MTMTMNFSTNILENPAASTSFPEDEGTNLLRNIGKSLQDQDVTYKKTSRFPQ